jgi:predicted DNA-binding transcriptional regulator YafY
LQPEKLNAMPKEKNRNQRLELLHRAFIEAGEKGLSRGDIMKLYENHEYYVTKSTLTEDLTALEEALQKYNIVEEVAIITEKLSGPGNPLHFRYSDLEYRLYESEKALNMHQRVQMEGIIKSLTGFGDYAVLQEVIPQLQSLVVQKKSDNEEQPRKIIEPEFNLDYVGREYVPALFNAIHHCQELQIKYKPFEEQETTEAYFPLYLKQFNQRWFLVVEQLDQPNQYKHLSLDRIVEITPTGKTFQYPIQFEPEDYFHDVVGVTVNAGSPLTVELRVKKPRAYYIRTKPIHKSQKEIKGAEGADREYIDYRIKVIPNKELYATLLEFGPDLEVLTPETVREEMRKLVRDMHKIYP